MSLMSGQDLIVVVLIIGLLFGAKRLPELGKSLGEGIREFKKSASGGSEEETETTEKDDQAKS